MKIRAAKEYDIGAIVALLAQLWPDQKQRPVRLRAILRAGISDKRFRYAVAEDDKEVVGFASFEVQRSLWQQGSIIMLNELVVDETQRGKGVGKMLLREAERYARQKRCSHIKLDTALHRRQTHRFYHRQKFEKTGYSYVKNI